MPAMLPESPAEFYSIHSRELIVEEDNIGIFLQSQGESIIATVSLENPVAQKPEIPGNYLPVERLVFNYQDLFVIIPTRQMIVLSPLPISHSINGFLNRGSFFAIRSIHDNYISILLKKTFQTTKITKFTKEFKKTGEIP
jgi:hypothetical protein